jgi:hypothetical protein
MLRKSCVIVILVIIGAECLFCQRDLKPGFIIMHNDDTIHGQINFRTDAVNSYRCEFSDNHTRELKTYFPNDIKAFKVENRKFYVSKDIILDSIEVKLFVEYLVDGIVDLFFIKHKNNDYYFIEKEGVMYRLTNEERVVKYEPRSFSESLRYGTNQTYTQKSNRYIGIMSIIFNDSPETVKQAQRTSFGFKSFIDITKDYHNKVCSDKICIDYTKSTQQYWCIEAYGGVVFSKIGLKTSPQFVTNTKPLMGVNFRFLPVKSYYLWNIIVGIYYSENSIKEKKMSHDLHYVNAVSPVLVSLDYSIIRTPIFLEYTLPFKKLKPAFSLGFSNSFLLGANQEVYPVYEQIISEDILGPQYDMKIRRNHIGLIGGLSLKYVSNGKNYGFINCYYEWRSPSVKISNLMDFQEINALIVGAGYGLKL